MEFDGTEYNAQYFPKPKPIRLKGKRLHTLYNAVYKRDNGLCVDCGKWVEKGTPPHHIVFKSQGGSDTMDNLKTVCMDCHFKYH